MNEGWISLHRQIQDSFLWKDKPFAKGQAWIDLLLLAYHEDTKKLWRGELKEYKRGTVNVSITFLAERWGWSWRRVKKFLKMLEKDGMITQNVTARDTAIFLTNYDVFQGERRANVRADVIPNVRADVTQSIMINNDNNDNNTRRRRGTSYAERKRKENEELDAVMLEHLKEDIAQWHQEYPGEPIPDELQELCEQFSINSSEI